MNFAGWGGTYLLPKDMYISRLIIKSYNQNKSPELSPVLIPASKKTDLINPYRHPP